MNNRIDWIVKKELVRGMTENIEYLGRDKTWSIINNSLQGINRLLYIEIYLNSLLQEKNND